MAEYPSLPLFTDAYLGDTNHLTTIEHGAYLLLLISMWRSKECQLPNDDKLLARYCRLTPAQWKRLKPVIMPFFDVENGYIIQQRLRDELSFVKRKSKSASKNAKSRWLKNKETDHADAMQAQCDGNAPTPTPTPTEKNIDKKEAEAEAEKRKEEEDKINAEFDTIWKEYPTKRNNPKKAAKDKYIRKRKDGNTYDDILQGVKNYSAYCKQEKTEEKYIAQTVTWINQERWQDEYKSTKPKYRGTTL